MAFDWRSIVVMYMNRALFSSVSSDSLLIHSIVKTIDADKVSERGEREAERIVYWI